MVDSSSGRRHSEIFYAREHSPHTETFGQVTSALVRDSMENMLSYEHVFDSLGLWAQRQYGQIMQEDELLRSRVEAELREQGLPVAIDPTGMGRIVALLGAEDGRKRERRLAAIRQQVAELEVRWKPGTHQDL